MIYDPRRRAIDLKRRILETMSAEEIEEYTQFHRREPQPSENGSAARFGAIDTTFDFRTDARGKDPDSHSPTLRSYHRLLWSKPLPTGGALELDDTVPKVLYLRDRSGLELASDSVVHTFTRWARLRHLVTQLPESENEAFRTLASTIGAMLVFPRKKINGKQTINGARGCIRSISDRIDLTLECVRRHYRSEPSPLAETLHRYGDFFCLFGDFRGYVEFFLLQDLVQNNDGRVRFFLPFDDFKTSAVPEDLNGYLKYRALLIEFVDARNRRIRLWAKEHLLHGARNGDIIPKIDSN